MSIKYCFPFIIFISLFHTGAAQELEYIAQKKSVGISAGTLTYTGRFSKGTRIDSHSSYYLSGFYRRRIYEHVYLRGEISGGELRASNIKADNPGGVAGAFATNIVEATIRGEYEILGRYSHKLVPYVTAGAGGYALLYYCSSNGPKSTGNKIGFVVPAGLGARYRYNYRVLLFAEGGAHLFTKNLDNYTGPGIHNPNRYYNVALGAIYELKSVRALW